MILLFLPATAAISDGAVPPLPTPCNGGPCGITSAKPFVQAGQIGNGGLPVVNGRNLTVQQLSEKAILNWQDFNIASGHSVEISQPGVTSATLNRIWSGDPSVIAGQLSAKGQVYLINRNGIVFDGGAQVNTGGLTASTLNIQDSTFQNGILSGNTGVATGTLPPVFQAEDGAAGDVTVNAGASIATTTGGRILLLGERVTNAGTITATDGQALLGAGRTVYLAASTDPAMRGILIEVDGGALPEASTVTNSGQISAPRGNVSLAGLIVNQNGSVRATTSVSANGSIYLVAGDTSRRDSTGEAPAPFVNNALAGFGQLLPNQGGTLTLGAGSVTEVSPDADDKGTITDRQQFLQSRIELVGKSVGLLGDATVKAPAGEVRLTAADNPAERVLLPTAYIGAPPDGSRVYLDDRSRIDVSGVKDVQVSVVRNLVNVELRANELQDAPLQRTGVLYGKTVVVDAEKGSTLADVTPFREGISRGVAEKSATGGSIHIESAGSVVTRTGSVLDVSGGSIAYQAGYGGTSKLVAADGRVYDISTAPADLQYVGLADQYSLTDLKWGVTRNWGLTPGLLPGYSSGKDAGQVEIIAPQAYLRGTALARTVPGPNQRSAASLPRGGSFVLGDAAAFRDSTQPIRDLRSPDITLTAFLEDELGAYYSWLGGDLPEETGAVVELAATSLTEGGFSQLGLYGNGRITVPAAMSLDLGTTGSLTAGGSSIVLDGALRATGGSVALSARNDLAGAQAGGHDVLMGSGASIYLRGNWVNDWYPPGTAPATGPVVSDGGDVRIGAAGSVTLSAGSVIDTSGGGWIDGEGKLHAGQGGSIALATDVGVSPALQTGRLRLEGTVRSAGLDSGGSLSLTTGSVRVAARRDPAASDRQLLLDPGFFTAGGFSSYAITGITGVTIADGTQVAPVQRNLVPFRALGTLTTGSSLASATRLDLRPEHLRAPTDLSIAATASDVDVPGAGNVLLGRGAVIAADPGAKVTLSAREGLTVLGSISAPAGTIELSTAPGVIVGTDDVNQGYRPGQQLRLGAEARLSATGFAAVSAENSFGARQGEVRDGGRIRLWANKGELVAEAGSLMDVSATSAVLDLRSPTGVFTPTAVAGAGGSISFHAREGLVLDGGLRGAAADVPGAAAGNLSIGLDLYDRTLDPNANLNPFATPYYTGDRVLTLAGSGAAAAQPGIGQARVRASVLTDGGFDALEIRSTDVIAVDGEVHLGARRNVTLDAPELSGIAGGRLAVDSAYVALGNADGRNQPGRGATLPVRNPQPGDAGLQVEAQLIDIRGNSVLSGFNQADLRSSGDLRLVYSENPLTAATDFSGSLRTTADLTLQAAQVYPVTGTSFTFNPLADGLYNAGRVTIRPATPGAVAPAVPYSAAGRLVINAADISQEGVLRAPLGEISLNASGAIILKDGSLTSVAAEGRTSPYGSIQNGETWTYQRDAAGAAATVTAPAEKQVNLAAPEMSLAAGARVDLSGGGDLYAYEFIAGPGGSRDVLDPGDGLYTAAIVPGMDSIFGALDHQYGMGSTVKPGDGLYLAGVPGLADGFHALLPARYALLPGAYAVRVLPDSLDQPIGVVINRADGSMVVGGRAAVAGTDILASRSVGLLLSPASVVRTQSEYTNTYANAFFSTKAASGKAALPADAGQLQLAAARVPRLDGSIGFAAGQFTVPGTDGAAPVLQQGRGGTVAFVAPRIEVVAAPDQSEGVLQLGAASLSGLGAETLILGASRSSTTAGEVLTVGADSVTVSTGAQQPLRAPEIILAARDQVMLNEGTHLEAPASGSGAGESSVLNVSGGGALLRVSGGAPATVLRSDTEAGAEGLLNIRSGAVINAAGSVLLDATAGATVESGARIAAASASLSSSRISVGEVPSGTAGLNLTDELLASLSGLKELILRSASSIDFFGTLELGGSAAATGSGLERLVLDSGGLAGYGAGAKQLRAGTISLVNSGPDTAASPAADGTGRLLLEAGAGGLKLGGGAKSIEGFGAVEVVAPGGVIGEGNGSVRLDRAGDLTIRSPRIAATAGVDQQLTNGSGAVNLENLPGVSATGESGAGARLAIAGTAVNVNSRIDLPAGVLSLRATGSEGGVSLGPTAWLNAAGFARPFQARTGLAPGGQVTLGADHGSVVVAEGAVVDVSGAATPDGAQGSDAGSLVVQVPEGEFRVAGELRGGAVNGSKSGNFSLDAGTLTDFSFLNSLLAGGRFLNEVVERVRSGDVLVAAGDVVRAAAFRLTADQGRMDVAGTLDTGGSGARTDGGGIELWSGGDLHLRSGASLIAAAGADSTQGRAGDVTLGSSTGQVVLEAGSTVDLHAAGPENDGRLTIRAARLADGLDLNVGALDATVLSSRPVTLEGVKIYTGGALALADAPGEIGFGPDGILAQETRTFANAAGAIAARLGRSDLQIRPGVEIRSDGDLVVRNDLDLRSTLSGMDDWRVEGVPINLTLRAAGDLVFSGSLSDGFTASPGQPFSRGVLAAGESAGYRLAAGADLAAADPTAAAGQGNFVLAPGKLIRTGNGNIAVAAGGDIRLGYDPLTGAYTEPGAQGSVIYTAGVPSAAATDFTVPRSAPGRPALGSTPAYPEQGGDLSLRAGGSVVAAPTSQLVTEWQYRRGSVRPDGSFQSNATGSQNTSWWIAFDQFQQGVGALGGGDVTVTAAGDIRNLSAVIPTTGRQPGLPDQVPDGSALVRKGGGNLQVAAGGDIRSGVFLVDQGSASLSAGGSVASGRTVTDTNPANPDDTPVYPILVLGDAAISVNARKDLTVEAAVNSTALPETVTNQRAMGSAAYFYTYSPDATLDLASSGGDIRLNNNANAIQASRPDGRVEANYTAENLTMYPPNLLATAFSGDLDIGGTRLFPAASGNLELIAAGHVRLASDLRMYEVDPQTAPGVVSPLSSLAPVGTGSIALDRFPLPLVPLHQADTAPVVIVARDGDIQGSASSLLVLPKRAELYAGGDISNLRLEAKNLRRDDVTLLSAGGSISYDTARNPDTNQLATNNNGIRLGGPGYLELVAGGDINLGNGLGVVSRGNLDDVRLPTGGAGIVVASGLGYNSAGSLRSAAIQAVVDRYLAPGSSYLAELTSYMRGLTGDSSLSQTEAVTRFAALSEAQKLPLVARVVYAELRATGLAHNLEGTDFERGYAAIATLFPARDAGGAPRDYQGDINLYFSQIKTEQGGDINLLAPGGSVVAGVANPPRELNDLKITRVTNAVLPAEANLGILALADGAIRGLADQDITVNRSRVLTLRGGDILLWASNGDIDAGRGAKTASAAPPPVIQTDANGNVFVNPSGAVSGSGIGQLLTQSGITAGSVDLIAPRGDVNAGDAGIRVAGNLNVAAVRVIGVDNIKVGGQTTGVPVEASGFGADLSGASSLGASAARAAESASVADCADADGDGTCDPAGSSLADAAVGWLDVFVEGFGEPDDDGKAKGRPDDGVR